MIPSQRKITQAESKHVYARWLQLAALLFSLVLLVTACGGGGDDVSDNQSQAANGAAGEGKSGIPTMPAARFAAPTTMIDATKVAETKGEGTPEPEGEPDLVFGQEAYGRLCAECHGEAGEGVADKGEAITGAVQDMDAFDDLLRTGGGYGNEHIFGPTKISDDGIESLFAYAQTLGGD